MKALHAGFCPECEQPICEGDEITPPMFGSDDPHWIHASCPKPLVAPVCPNCWLEMALSGEHECEYDR